MTVAFDAFSSRAFDGGTLTHTPVGVPKAVFVMVGHANNTDRITAVTYGGVAMTRVGMYIRASGRQSTNYLYFLGSGIPTGAQNVVISGTTDSGNEGCMTFTGAGDTEIVDSDGGSGALATTISALLSYAGRSCIAVVSASPGEPGGPLSGETQDLSAGHSNGNEWFGHQTTAGTADFTAGCTSTPAGDYSFNVAAFSEIAVSVSASAQVASGTGVANNASIAANAQVASGAGVANNATSLKTRTVLAPAAQVNISGTVPTVVRGWLLSYRPFGMSSFGTLLHVRPFRQLNAPLTILHARPFSIFASVLEPYVPPTIYSTTLATSVIAGATSMTITANNGSIVAGMFLDVGGEIIQVGPGYVSGTTIPLASPFLLPHLAGVAVSQSFRTAPVFMIFDKAGLYLGTLADAYISEAPTHLISQQGNASFYSPRNATNLSLLKGDRLVLIGDPYGEPWAGAIEPQEWGEGKEQVNLSDLFSLFDLRVSFDTPIGDNVSATAIYQHVLNAFNVLKRDSGEIQFGSDMTGVKTFNGDLVMDGSFLEVFETIAERSGTEYALRYEVRGTPTGTKLLPYLVVRDRFSVPGGATLQDGPNANIVGEIRYTKDTSQTRTGLILRGQPTDIASLVPEWASWAVHEIEPTIYLNQAPLDADQRVRIREESAVDWSLSKAEQRRLADLTVAQIRGMYATFLYAIHSELGRPWHEGWAYIGPPDLYEPNLVRTSWLTDLRLAERNNAPVSLVMRSGPKSLNNAGSRLVVTYNRVTGVQTVVTMKDSLIDVGSRWSTVLVSGRTYTLWTTTSSTSTYQAAIVGAGQTVELGAPLTSKIADTVVTYKYRAVSVNLIVKLTAARAIRSSPLVLTGNIIRTDPSGTLFTARQKTSTGTSVGGTREWYGNAAGTEWVPLAHVSTVRLVPSGTHTIRQIQSGAYDNSWVRTAELGTLTKVPGDSLQFIQKVYPFEAALIAKWDPRRDGIGVYSSKLHVDYAALSTRARWRLQSWSADEATTSLEQGVSAINTQLLVTSSIGFPPAPFRVRLGDESDGVVPETVAVTAAGGPLWTVIRAQAGSTATIHEAGESVTLLNAPVFDGFVYDHTWAAGQAYAQELLTRLNRPTQLLDFEVMSNTAGVALGSLHTVNITTEGPWGTGITGTVRIVGYARDPLDGMMGLVMEVEP